MHVFFPTSTSFFFGISNTCNVAASNMRVVVGFYLVCCCCCSRFYNETNTRILNGCASTVRRGAWLATWPFSWLIYAFKVQQHKKKKCSTRLHEKFPKCLRRCSCTSLPPTNTHTHTYIYVAPALPGTDI